MIKPRVTKPFGVSVVIPTFDRPEVLRAVDSVASASPDNVEIIVVDDASKVDVRSFLPRRNSHSIRIRSYRLETNGGPQVARNLGIRRASFQYVAFLDSDDEFHPTKMDRVFDRLNRGDVDVLYHAASGLERYNRIGRFWRRFVRPVIPFAWWAAMLNPIGTPTLIVRRKARLAPPRLRHCEDYGFLLRYCGSGVKVDYLDEDLATVHRRPGTVGGLSGELWAMRKGEFAARRVLLKDPGLSSIPRFLIGTACGCIRVGADVLRARYWR